MVLSGDQAGSLGGVPLKFGNDTIRSMVKGCVCPAADDTATARATAVPHSARFAHLTSPRVLIIADTSSSLMWPRDAR